MNKKTTTDIMYAKSKMSETRAKTSPNARNQPQIFYISDQLRQQCLYNLLVSISDDICWFGQKDKFAKQGTVTYDSLTLDSVWVGGERRERALDRYRCHIDIEQSGLERGTQFYIFGTCLLHIQYMHALCFIFSNI